MAKKKTKARASAKSAKASKRAPARKPAPARKRASSKKPGPMFEKVAFTMFHVHDTARARAFYEQVLGLERGLASPDGVWTEYDLPGGGCLALFRHPDPAFVHRPGGASVAFEVADLDALNRRLSAAGVEYPFEMVHGPACRMSHILDSEGNAIILHEFAHKR